MKERDYYKDKYDYDKYDYDKKDKYDCDKKDKWECDKKDKWEYEKKVKWEKDENSSYAGSKAVAVNKNWNILCVPSGRYDGEDEAMRRGESDPYDFEDMMKKGYDGDDGKEAEAVAYGKAVICNKNINVVIGY